jgi:hypothetical protein
VYNKYMRKDTRKYQIMNADMNMPKEITVDKRKLKFDPKLQQFYTRDAGLANEIDHELGLKSPYKRVAVVPTNDKKPTFAVPDLSHIKGMWEHKEE